MLSQSTTRRRLRIAYVVHDYNRHGGHSRYVAELATRFKRDHEVHVYANTFDEPEPDDLTFHRVPAWRPNALASILSFVVPATFGVGCGFDIVHAQGLCGLRHNVATAHFCQPAWHGALAQVNRGLTWKQWLARLLITPLERRALCGRGTRRVIAISEGVRADLARYFRRADGVRLIYHGVDLDTFHPRNRPRYRDEVRASLGIDPASCLALFVGNLQKGAAAAIRAVARVPGVRLLLVSGSDAAADRAVAEAESVADRVLFAAHSKQVERYYAAADLFVFPTLYEPYGMVISEAMASGLPVITPRTAGAAELITHGISGWLTAAAWDVEEIAAGLRTLAAAAPRRAAMGAAARAAVEAYTWDDAARRTMDVYREVVGTLQGNSGACPPC
jgi:UDP-glucose:(heptosyl)LPS alpha-1,3-glucosyltransferase